MVTAIPQPPVVVDTDVELVCIVTGVDPPDNVTWTFNGMELFIGNKTTGGNFTQTFLSGNYGSYTCSAANDFGSNSSTIEVLQAGIAICCSLGWPDTFLGQVRQIYGFGGKRRMILSTSGGYRSGYDTTVMMRMPLT